MSHEPLKQSDLDQFTGSETFYRHGLMPQYTFTDGAKFVADHAGAYWLIDEIALSQAASPAVRAEHFQVWTLTVDLEKQSAVLTCEDGDYKEVFRKTIGFTDFPNPEIKLWCVDRTIFLPSEY